MQQRRSADIDTDSNTYHNQLTISILTMSSDIVAPRRLATSSLLCFKILSITLRQLFDLAAPMTDLSLQLHVLLLTRLRDLTAC